MSTRKRLSFAESLLRLADIGYLPARVFQQQQLGNPDGCAVLLTGASDEEMRSTYLQFLKLNDPDAIIAIDPAHLLARHERLKRATASGDDWGIVAEKMALEEYDQSAFRTETELRAFATAPQPENSFTLSSDEVRLLRQTPVITETLADLFRDQGHHRMARAMYKRLLSEHHTATLEEKYQSVARQSAPALRTTPERTTQE